MERIKALQLYYIAVYLEKKLDIQYLETYLWFSYDRDIIISLREIFRNPMNRAFCVKYYTIYNPLLLSNGIDNCRHKWVFLTNCIEKKKLSNHSEVWSSSCLKIFLILKQLH